MEIYLLNAILVGRMQIAPNICQEDYLFPDARIESVLVFCPDFIEWGTLPDEL